MAKVDGRKLVFVEDPGGDWVGLYVDGKLVTEGHSLNWNQVLSALGVPFDRFECDGEWIADNGTLPTKLGSVKRKETK